MLEGRRGMNPQEFEVDIYGSSAAFHPQQDHHHGQMVVLSTNDGGMEDAGSYDNGGKSSGGAWVRLWPVSIFGEGFDMVFWGLKVTSVCGIMRCVQV